MTHELHLEDLEVGMLMLPDRETLCGISITIGSPTIVIGVNTAIAINAASIGTEANAIAMQYLIGIGG